MSVFSGGQYIYNNTINGSYKCLIMQGIMQNLCTASPNAGWSNLAMAAGQGPGNVGVVTVNISASAINWTGHGFLGGEQIAFQVVLGGTYPSGFSNNTLYYVKYINANSFNISSSLGGSNITFSGTQTGTLYCYSRYMLLQSQPQTNVTNPIVVKLQDNFGRTVGVSIQNQSGSVIGPNAFDHGGALITSFTTPYQIAATRYWFMCSMYQYAWRLDYVFAGMLYVPSFLTGVTDHGFVLCNGLYSENDTTCYSFRGVLNIGGNYAGNSQVIWNANFCEQHNDNNNELGLPETVAMTPVNWQNPQGYRWANDDLFMSDVLMSAGISIGSEGKVKGQFFDMVWIADSYTMDTQDTFAGHTWLNITQSSNYNYSWWRGSIWLAIS